jgi:hypothetical protein
MIGMFYITWQPDVAEAGNYFLTFVEAGPSTNISDLMLEAHKIEELEVSSYDLCSIIYVAPNAHDGETQVIY